MHFQIKREQIPQKNSRKKIQKKKFQNEFHTKNVNTKKSHYIIKKKKQTTISEKKGKNEKKIQQNTLTKQILTVYA